MVLNFINNLNNLHDLNNLNVLNNPIILNYLNCNTCVTYKVNKKKLRTTPNYTNVLSTEVSKALVSLLGWYDSYIIELPYYG